MVKLQNLALIAYPTPADLPVAPIDAHVSNDQDKFDRETRENQNRRKFSQMDRERHKTRLFKKAMPNFIRLKLLEEPEDATIQELYTKARQELILRELCPVDDWSRDGFNEMSSENSEKLLTVLTKMSENQNSLENKIDALTQKPNSLQQNSSNTYKDNEQQTWQVNFRGQTYQNRGNRGYSNNKGYQNRNYQKQGSNFYQNNQNRGSYGNNFIEEAIEGEITLEAITEETSRITITIISIPAILSSKDIKKTKQHSFQEGILKLLHFQKKFAIVAVIQTIPLEIVKLEEKAKPEVDKNRFTRNQKTNKATNVSQSREKQ